MQQTQQLTGGCGVQSMVASTSDSIHLQTQLHQTAHTVTSGSCYFKYSVRITLVYHPSDMQTPNQHLAVTFMQGQHMNLRQTRGTRLAWLRNTQYK